MKKIIFALLLLINFNLTFAQPPIRIRTGIAKKLTLADKLVGVKNLFPDFVLVPECGLIGCKVGTPPRQGYCKDGTIKFKITETNTNYKLEVLSNDNQDYIDIVAGTYTSNHSIPCYIRLVDKVTNATIYYSVNGSFPSTQNQGFNLVYTAAPIVCQ